MSKHISNTMDALATLMSAAKKQAVERKEAAAKSQAVAPNPANVLQELMMVLPRDLALETYQMLNLENTLKYDAVMKELLGCVEHWYPESPEFGERPAFRLPIGFRPKAFIWPLGTAYTHFPNEEPMTPWRLHPPEEYQVVRQQPQPSCSSGAPRASAFPSPSAPPASPPGPQGTA